MGYFKPSKYTIENALKEATRYDGIYVGDNFVTKDHATISKFASMQTTLKAM